MITIALGPPGTGKTTFLLSKIEEALSKGFEPEEIAYLAFTKKAAEVAVKRAQSQFNLSRDRFPYFRTIHSLAYHGHRILSSQVMGKDEFREFGEEWGYTFTGTYEYGSMTSLPYGSGTGDSLLRCYDLSRARMITPIDEAENGDYLFNAYMIDQFVKRLQSFKLRRELITFDDFLDRPLSLPSVRILIIDEAQDLTPHQWFFIRNTFKSTPEIWVAGDDDQCIYEWSGADLRFFLGLKAETQVLNQSYRLPYTHWELANRISSKIVNRYDKTWYPRKETGQIQRCWKIEEIEFDSESEILVIGRRQRDIGRISKMLWNLGLNHSLNRKFVTDQAWFQAIFAYEELRQGEAVSLSAIRQISRYLTNYMTPPEKIRGKEAIYWEDCACELIGRPPWYEICDKLSKERQEFAKLTMINDCPRNIHVSTIHAVKGDEYDNVVLLDKLAGRPKKTYNNDPDTERRVWYVGCTRARQNLVICGSGNPIIN